MSISWKKRLLAAILALVMVMGDVPTGLLWPNSGRVTAEIVEDAPAAPVVLEGTILSDDAPAGEANAPAQPEADSPAAPAAEEPAVPASESTDNEDQSAPAEAPAQESVNATESTLEGENVPTWGGVSSDVTTGDPSAQEANQSQEADSAIDAAPSQEETHSDSYDEISNENQPEIADSENSVTPVSEDASSAQSGENTPADADVTEKTSDESAASDEQTPDSTQEGEEASQDTQGQPSEEAQLQEDSADEVEEMLVGETKKIDLTTQGATVRLSVKKTETLALLTKGAEAWVNIARDDEKGEDYLPENGKLQVFFPVKSGEYNLTFTLMPGATEGKLEITILTQQEAEAKLGITSDAQKSETTPATEAETNASEENQETTDQNDTIYNEETPTKEDENENNNEDELTEENGDEEATEPTEEKVDEETTEPTEENNDEETTEPTEENSDEETTEPTEENGDEETTEPTEENSDEETTEPTEENTGEETTEPTEENNDEDTSEPTAENSDEEITEPTEDNSDEEAEPNEEDQAEDQEIVTDEKDETILDKLELSSEDLTIKPLTDEETERYAQLLSGAPSKQQIKKAPQANQTKALEPSEGEESAQTLEPITGFVAFDISRNASEDEPLKEAETYIAHIDLDTPYALPQAEGAEIASVTYELYHFDADTNTLTKVEASFRDDYATGLLYGFDFETTGFSPYVVKYTVDFSYIGEDGETYEFSMPGGGVLLLSELFDALHIDENVADVVDVTFTDYSLLEISRISKNTQVEESRVPAARISIEAAAALPDGEVLYSDEWNITYKSANAGDWTITSLKKFSTEEKLTVTFAKGRTIVIDVTDEQYHGIDINDGKVSLQAVTSAIHASTASNVTETPQETNAAFDVSIVSLLSDNGLQAIQDYIEANGSIPAIEYDFSDYLAASPLKEQVSGAIIDLKDNGNVIGTVTIDANGKATIQYTDKDWLMRKSQLSVKFTMTVQTDETAVNAGETVNYQFPGTSDTLTVHYKDSLTIENKKLQAVENADGSYTLNYTAKLTNTKDMDSLTFKDTFGGDGKKFQTLVGGSVKVNGNTVNVKTTDNGFSFDFPKDGNKVKAGEYTVTYSTTITKAQYDSLEEGEASRENNSAKWIVDGTNEKDGGSTTYEIKKPVTPVSVDKQSKGADGQYSDNVTVNDDGTITYKITYGDNNTNLSKLTITDSMTDVQVLQGDIKITTPSGGTINMPSDSIRADDGRYSAGMTQLYEYTFGENAGNGPAVVEYTVKLIDDATAKANNIYGKVTVQNTAQENRSYKNDTTTTEKEYPPEPNITVGKTASTADVDENGNWLPEATVTYTITIDTDAEGHDLSNVRVSDLMTDAQVIDDFSNVMISVGGAASIPLSTYLTNNVQGAETYKQDATYSKNDTTVFNFVLPNGATGPIEITYSTKVIKGTDATASKIYDLTWVGNKVQAGNKGTQDGGNVGFPEEVKYPLTKTVSGDGLEDDNHIKTDNFDQPITYTIIVGEGEADMSNVVVTDQMTDMQKVVGKVKVTTTNELSNDVKEKIEAVGGTIIGANSFYMPTSTSGYSNDGFAWAAYHDDGNYSKDNWVRVFQYRFPEGIGAGPITITYDTKVISEEEARNAGIQDTQNVYNQVNAENNQRTTVVYPEYPGDVKSEPTLEKRFVRFGEDGHTVYWAIDVQKTEDSAYPLTNVVVQEGVNKTMETYFFNTLGYWEQYAIKAEDIDMIGAVVTTESGLVLQPGVDYDIHKNAQEKDTQGNVIYNPFWEFHELNEKITIEVSYYSPNLLTGGFDKDNLYQVNNWAIIGDKEETVGATKTTTSIDFVKSSRYDENNQVIQWSIMLNPDKKTIEPDTTFVKFEDILPDGHELLNFDYTYYDANRQKTSSEALTGNYNVKTDAPSIHVAYSGGNGTSAGALDIDLERYGTYKVSFDASNPNHFSVSDIEPHKDPYNIDATDPKYLIDYGLSGRTYKITYYTKLTDEEWKNVTSSLTGAKDYTNHGSATYDGNITVDGTSTVTVTSENFLKKFDDAIENGQGVIVDGNGDLSKQIPYRVEVNPTAAQLNYGNALTLSDRVDTNMEFDPSSLEIWAYSEDQVPVDVSKTLAELPSPATKVTPGSGDYADVTVTYNDDSRIFTIGGLPDNTAYRVTYKTTIRALGEDTFTNTATLTGGGSHSSTVTDKHKNEWADASSTAIDMSLYLRKIDENNITKTLNDVTFELYELSLVGPLPDTDEEWLELYDQIDYIQHHDDATAAAYLADIRARFKIVQGSDDQVGDAVTTGKQTVGRNKLDDGIVMFPSGSQHINEKKLYYWVETENNNENYKAENDPHYFVLYPEYELVITGGDYVKTPISGDTKKKIAWALDDAVQYANGITVASMPGDVTWSVTNVEEGYTSISTRKVWAGDSDNIFETRPKDGIQLQLYRKIGGGQWEAVGEKVAVNGSTYTNTNGQTVETWPNANWAKLPTDDGKGNKYYYKVVEDNVPNYNTTYSYGEDGVEGGQITVTNTMIPTTTNITVSKVWDAPEDAVLPDQIVITLYQYTKDKDGNVTGPEEYGLEGVLQKNADGTYSEYTFRSLPARDKNGNSYTYTVVEDPIANINGKPVVTTYSDNGEGTIDDIVITNYVDAKSSLKLKKTIDESTVSDDEKKLTEAQKANITFVVEGPDGYYQSFIYSQFDENGELLIEDLPVGTYTVTESRADFPGLSRKTTMIAKGGERVSADSVDAEVTVSGGEVEVVNRYSDHIDITVNKMWDGVSNVTGTLFVAVYYRLAGSNDQLHKVGTSKLYGVDTTSFAGEVELNAGNGWSNTWSGLPVVNDEGQKIEYYVWEYLNPNQEVWHFTYKLYNSDSDFPYIATYDVDGSTVQGVLASTDSSHSGEFVVMNATGDLTITNRDKFIRVQKVWQGVPAADGQTPSQWAKNNEYRVVVQLDRYVNGVLDSTFDSHPAHKEFTMDGNKGAEGNDNQTQTNFQETTADDATDTWEFSWYGLPASDSHGNEYTYKAREVKVYKRYSDINLLEEGMFSASVSQDGRTITNTYNLTKEISVSKVWDDTAAAGADVTHPDVTLNLYQNADTNEGATNTPMYSAVIEYGTDETTVTIKQASTDLASVSFAESDLGTSKEIKNGNALIAVATLNEDDTVTVAWKNLPDKDTEGKAYIYTVDENAVSGYVTTVSGGPFNGYTVTNTRTTNPGELVVSKIWVDQDGQTITDASAMPGVTLKLMKESKSSGSDTGKTTVYVVSSYQQTTNPPTSINSFDVAKNTNIDISVVKKIVVSETQYDWGVQKDEREVNAQVYYWDANPHYSSWVWIKEIKGKDKVDVNSYDAIMIHINVNNSSDDDIAQKAIIAIEGDDGGAKEITSISLNASNGWVNSYTWPEGELDTDNYTYYLEEVAQEGVTPIRWTVNGSVVTGTTSGSITDGVVAVTNQKTVEKGRLTVKKEWNGLTYADLTEAQKAALANVTFTVKNSSDAPVSTFHLSAADMGESLEKTIILPVGSYTIEETGASDNVPAGFAYKQTNVTVTGTTQQLNMTSASSVGVPNGGSITVTFENVYEDSTVDLSLQKQVQNDSNAQNAATQLFSFTAEIEGENLDSSKYTLNWNPGPGQPVDTKTDSDGKKITYATQLVKDQILTITGLPKGVTYTVTETSLPASYAYMSASATDGEVDNNAHTAAGTASAATEIVFINEYVTGSLNIQKTVSLSDGANAEAKDFYFTVLKDGVYYYLNEQQELATVATISAEDFADAENKSIYYVKVSSGSTDGVTLNGLPLGEYTVTEVTAPDGVSDYSVDIAGYTFDSENSFTSETVNITTKNQTVEIEAENKYSENPGSLKIKKNVTVNGEATTSTLADGTYTFTIKQEGTAISGGKVG
ncbi:MAG: Cna B-type domain-containing protein, partial [Clostridia bacterium]|nr:Cna B-type domain-containing protein [Clostridia bacterium]